MTLTTLFASVFMLSAQDPTQLVSQRLTDAIYRGSGVIDLLKDVSGEQLASFIAQPLEIQLTWQGPSGQGRHHSLPACMQYRGHVLRPAADPAGPYHRPDPRGAVSGPSSSLSQPPTTHPPI